MVWLLLTLRIFGILLLIILGVIIALLFVPAKIQLRWEGEDRYAEGKFLFFKYRYDLDFLGKKAKEAPAASKPTSEASKVQATFPAVPKESSPEPLTPIASSPPQEPVLYKEEHPQGGFRAPKSLKAPRPLKALRPLRFLKALKAPKSKKAPRLKAFNPFKFLGSLTKLRAKIHHYLEIFMEGKPVLYRLLKKIKVKRAWFYMRYSVDSPDLNAQLLGILWAVEAQIHSFFRRRFKKVRHHHFDLQSDFTGDHVDIALDYILTIRPIDLIVVALKSLTEIKTLRKMIAKQPAAASA